jgi:hypothetical protein
LGGSGVGFWDLDRQTRHYRINRYIDEKYEKFCSLCVIVFKILWCYAFIAVSYGVFQECRLDRHFWIGVDIINGIGGGILLVYPLMVIIKHDLLETYNNWITYLVCVFLLFGFTLMCSGFLGWSQLD